MLLSREASTVVSFRAFTRQELYHRLVFTFVEEVASTMLRGCPRSIGLSGARMGSD